MKSILCVYMVLSLLMSSKCEDKSTQHHFCTAFESNDKDLKNIVDTFLNSLNKNLSKEQQFIEIQNWLLKQNCVKEVKITEGYLRTEPPIKKIIVTVNTQNNVLKKTINISVESDRLTTESIVQK